MEGGTETLVINDFRMYRKTVNYKEHKTESRTL